MPATDHRDRRLGRAEQADLVLMRQAAERREPPFRVRRQGMGGAHQSAGVVFGRGAVFARNDERREPAERRHPGAAALLRFLAVEALHIAGEERADHRMLRLPGLHQCPARAAPCGRRGP